MVVKMREYIICYHELSVRAYLQVRSTNTFQLNRLGSPFLHHYHHVLAVGWTSCDQINTSIK